VNVSDMVRAMKAVGCSDEQIVAAIVEAHGGPARQHADRQAQWRAQTGLTTKQWAALRQTIFQRDGYKCRECGASETREDGRTTLNCDHVVAVRNGGSSDPSNLVTLCCSCHSKKTRRESASNPTNDTTRHTTNDTTHPTNHTTQTTRLARVEDNLLTTELSGKEEKNISHERHAVTPRQILLECLSAESADAVLAHRRAKRCPLTVRAAQLLAKGFTATGDPNAAADMMIERGWQGFKPEWYDNERAGNGQGKGQSRRSVSDVAPSFIKRLDEQFAYLDGPKDRGPDGGPIVQFLPPQRGQRS
jgi:5-methylcytosine-specific restriction endonuclease McrA